MRVRILGALATTLTTAALLSACGGSASDDSGPKPVTLTVFAASSLTATFQKIGDDFHAAHPDVKVDFSFGGSSDLAAQIQQGAPADVFASADTANMAKLTADKLQDGDPQNFASNTLEIATPPNNPAHIASFADLAKPGVKTVVCAPEVPCGAATQRMETLTGTTIKPVSEEESVTDVLGKVTSGEADAGLVYVTDVTAAGDKVKGITFPQSSKVVNTYPIVATKDAKNATLAQEFVDFVLSDSGQSILADAGFAKP